MSTDIKIVEIVATGPVVKAVSHWTGKGFQFPVTYTLVDGRTFDTVQHHTLKRDAVAASTAMPIQPTNVKAIVADDGTLVGTSTSYRIGGAS